MLQFHRKSCAFICANFYSIIFRIWLHDVAIKQVVEKHFSLKGNLLFALCPLLFHKLLNSIFPNQQYYICKGMLQFRRKYCAIICANPYFLTEYLILVPEKKLKHRNTAFHRECCCSSCPISFRL